MGEVAARYPDVFDEGAPEEPLHVSDRTRVSRVTLVGGSGTVICKEFFGANAPRRLQHERSILRRLAGVPQVAQLADVEAPGDLLLMEDIAGAPLLDGTAVLTLEQLVEVAAQLAVTLAAVHAAGVVHKDITPANWVLAPAPGGGPDRPYLVDFELASTFALEKPRFTHQNEIAGTLAYLAPEQTGRTGLPVDQRADLYGLGATLYHLAVGRPPFDSSDLLQLVHDQLATAPVPPHERDPRIPRILSDIIVRLLEKEPDRRYQSADGLAHDLLLVQEGWDSGEQVHFELGRRDFPLRLAPPSRLVGRDAEISILGETFTAVLDGQQRSVLVAGAPGAGKSALLDELRPLVTGAAGWLVSGKFDQYRLDGGSDAVQQVMIAMFRLLLAEPEAEIAHARVRLGEELGSNLDLACALFPEMAQVMERPGRAGEGELPPPPARLRQIGMSLLRAMASPRRPVVMVVDDLQWATATPMALIDGVLTEGGVPGLMLVGAYRQTEVDEGHPLSVMLERWERLGVAPKQIMLANLEPAGLGELVAGMLRMPEPAVASLAQAVAVHTHGNPFDTVELVNALRRDRVLRPGGSLDTAAWTWDADAARR